MGSGEDFDSKPKSAIPWKGSVPQEMIQSLNERRMVELDARALEILTMFKDYPDIAIEDVLHQRQKKLSAEFASKPAAVYASILETPDTEMRNDPAKYYTIAQWYIIARRSQANRQRE